MTIYAISTQTRINPQDPAEAEYFSADQTCYVAHKCGSTSVTAFTSGGSDTDDRMLAEVGTTQELRHGSDGGSYRGMWTIIGAVRFSDGHTVGDVPAKKIPHWVFK